MPSKAAWGQQESHRRLGEIENLRPGIVVEEVARHSSADRTGIRAGDILLSWSRGYAQDQIESPFDLSHIVIEQGPRGAVTLTGLRGDEKRTWQVGPDDWGLKTRPNFQPALLDSYLKCKGLARGGNPAQAVECWRDAQQNSPKTWLRSWFLSHVPESLSEAQQKQEADRMYQEAVDAADGAEAVVVEQILRTWGQSLLQRNDIEGAERRFREALAQSRKLGDESLTMAADLHELGLVFSKRFDRRNAEDYFRQSLAIKERLAPDSLTVSKTLERLASYVLVRGDLAAAEQYLLHGLAIAEKLAPGKELTALHLLRLGIVEGQRNNLVKAERYLRRAVAVEEKAAPGSVNFGVILGTLGNVLFERGDLAQA